MTLTARKFPGSARGFVPFRDLFWRFWLFHPWDRVVGSFVVEAIDR